MKIYTLHQEQVVARPLQEVFHYFSRPENLSQLTPSWMHFEILTPSPIEMKKGTFIDYKIKVKNFPLKWKTKITQYDPPHYFIDVQLKGPYVKWHHTHHFEAIPEGTRIVDHVEYALPFGWLGRLLHWIQIKKDLEAIFNYRKEILTKILS